MTYPKYYIRHLVFNDGREMDVDRDSIVVFVGANNVGKSRSLKDISLLAKNHAASTVVVKSIVLNLDESENLGAYLDEVAHKEPGAHNGFVYSGLDYRFYVQDAKEYFQNRADYDECTNLFCRYLSTDKRLEICQPPNTINMNERPIHPIHSMAQDVELRKLISGSFFKAFGFYLIPDMRFGKTVPLRCVSEIPTLEGLNCKDELEREDAFYERLRKFSSLHEQGDGMRSFAGVLLNLALNYIRTFFIDEPEAFLHPPQARIMGEMIAKLLNQQQQVFIATHSESIVQGLIEAAPDRVKIVRLVRDGEMNSVSLLENTEIAKLWNDPVLRYSNIMSGMFHAKTVVCESDSDCKFYSAVDACNKSKEGTFSTALFTCGGGKHRLPVIAKALKALNIDFRLVPDIDVLDNERIFKDICEAVGLAWNDIEVDYRRIAMNLQVPRDKVPRSEIKAVLTDVMSREDTFLAENELSRIRDCLKTESKWDLLKKGGEAIIPPGEPTQAWKRLGQSLKAKGVFIVPVGVLENFVKDVGGLHGPKWVDKVLQEYTDLNGDVYCEARKFVKAMNI
jgi:predicted ATPase